ncbi:hypothetical protein FZEAL_7271 [Fusarium zealandicum]|uniref:Major facilitator superfamily (MFS) profile domain-containing protein n=1 Tax=Fusarium zealandicum TaxID=1053134 RepID=A0A8H4XIT4_9HYPO|nr:hypothetical protein FZEAL_7271 [Fusarium zealandicum]
MPPPRVDNEAPYQDEVTADHHNPSSNATYDEKNATGERQVSKAALLRNPLVGLSRQELLADVDAFVNEKGLFDHREDFRKGALVAQVNNQAGAFEKVDLLDEDDRAILRKEETHRWHQPFMLYFLCSLCAGSAIVQGMDQTTVNGAQEFYNEEFAIEGEWMQGFTNGAPYLCSALIGCWTSPILNRWTGRRGTIFISCLISTATGFWMAASTHYANFLVARFMLGFAVGAKSSTTPVYSAESTPKNIRGALTMMWQMWTAFGIALGFIVCVAFEKVTIIGGENSPWRWMMASTSVPPLIVMLQVYFCPESPRWYMERGQFDKAYRSVRKLRFSGVQAARDMYYAYKLLEIERGEREGRNLLKEFFTVRRNRRAAQSAWFTMFMQQFCGVNIIAYYSTSIFQKGGYSKSDALLVSMGSGIINFLFAIPAIYTIDTFGRRNLLLVTFPLMALCMFFTAGTFKIEEDNPYSQARIGCITTGLYLFMAVYSPGLGPVPFTYSAEAFPLHVRDIGMASSTAITWGFNFIISLTWPPLSKAFSDTGGFCWYGAWNIFGWIFCYFMLPETKNLTLEELDNVFGVSNKEHAGYYLKKLPWYLKKYLLFQDVPPFPPLYEFAANDGHYPEEKPSVRHAEGRSTGQSSDDGQVLTGRQYTSLPSQGHDCPGEKPKSLEDRMIDFLGRATSVDIDYNDYEDVIDEFLGVILQAGRPLFAPEDGSHHSPSLHVLLFAEILTFRLVGAADGKPSVLVIDPTETYTCVTDEEGFDDTTENDFDFDASLTQHSTEKILVSGNFVRGGGHTACRVQIGDAELFCIAQAAGGGLVGSAVGRELSRLHDMCRACSPNPNTPLRVPRLVGYVKHGKRGRIVGFLRQWTPGGRLSDTTESPCLHYNTYNWWAPKGFFETTIRAGEFSFTVVKLVDVTWNFVVGRGGQTILALPATYTTFWLLTCQKEPSLIAILRMSRQFLLHGLASKTAMLFITWSALLVLGFPTFMSSMAGYTTINTAYINVEGVGLTHFSNVYPIAFVIEDGSRINLTDNANVPDKACASILKELGQELSGPMLEKGGRFRRLYYSSFSKDKADECELFWEVVDYVTTYGFRANEPAGIKNETKIGDIRLPAPPLNISGFNHPMNSPRMTSEASKKLVFQNPPRFDVSGDMYNSTMLENAGICQPVRDEFQKFQRFQWGFSFLQLFLFVVLLLVWTIGIILLRAKAYFTLEFNGFPEISTSWKGFLEFADVVQAQMNSAGIDYKTLNDDELKSQIEDLLKGGSVSSSQQLLQGSYSIQRGLRGWMREQVWWIVALLLWSVVVIVNCILHYDGSVFNGSPESLYEAFRILSFVFIDKVVIAPFLPLVLYFGSSSLNLSIMAESLLSQPLKLPCGLTLPNRLIKAALAEQMSDCQKLPTPAQFERTYGGWADGGWGMVMTGNVQVDEKFLGSHDDNAINASLPEDKVLEAYTNLASVCRRAGTPAIMQICHPGRQSPLGAGTRSIWSKTLAPSAVQLDMGSDFIARLSTSLIFGTPMEMSLSDIDAVVQRFANAAKVAFTAGFDGIEIHAAHGYLLAQFLSAKTNLRTDAYGGSVAARAKIVIDIIKAIRAIVPSTFCVGLKFNSADHQSSKTDGASTELQDCLDQATMLAEAGLDFLEVSGGTYENPTMLMGADNVQKSERTAARESFFLEFAREMRAKLPNMPLMVTGGFRTRAGMEAALNEGACDLIGIGRPAILNPSLPLNTILSTEVPSEDAKVYARKVQTPWLLKRFGPKSVGAGVESTWYSKQMQKIGQNALQRTRIVCFAALVDLDLLIEMDIINVAEHADLQNEVKYLAGQGDSTWRGCASVGPDISQDDVRFKSTGAILYEFPEQDPWHLSLALADIRTENLRFGPRVTSQDLGVLISIPESPFTSQEGKTRHCGDEDASSSYNGILSEECQEALRKVSPPIDGRFPRVDIADVCGQPIRMWNCMSSHPPS